MDVWRFYFYDNSGKWPILIITRLNAFTPSCLFNATVVAAQCHSQQTNSESLARRHHQVRNVQFLAPKKLIVGPSPHLGTAMQTAFSPLSFGKSFMKILSAVPENIFVAANGKKQKKNKKKQKNHL